MIRDQEPRAEVRADERVGSAADFFRSVRRHVGLVLATTTVGAGAALFLSLTATPQYVASTTLFVSVSGRAAEPGSAYTGGLFAQQRAQSYAAMVREPRVSETVVEQLGLDLTPAQVRERLEASVEPESVLLSIRATDEQPGRAAAMAGAAGRAVSGIVADLDRQSADGSPLVRAVVLQPARRPSLPTSPVLPRDVGLGAGLGLVAGLAGAALRSALDRTVRTPEALRQAGVPLLATVRSRRRRGSRSATGRAAAPYRQVRTLLRLGQQDSAVRTLLVTGVGRASSAARCARELALAAGQAGASVVLVDCDVRRQTRGTPVPDGFSTVLTGTADTLPLVRTLVTPAPLAVLPAGPPLPADCEPFTPEAVARVLTALQQRFDLVVLTAPTLDESDALALSPRVDGVLLVVGEGVTTRDELDEALDVLRTVGAVTLGAVLDAGRPDQHQPVQGDVELNGPVPPLENRLLRRTVAGSAQARRRAQRDEPERQTTTGSWGSG